MIKHVIIWTLKDTLSHAEKETVKKEAVKKEAVKKETVKVTKENCASAIGSGALDVFATPSMIALMENTAMRSIEGDLNEEETTVGTFIQADHLKASVVGENLICHSIATEQNGREITFEVKVTDAKQNLVGRAIHKRFVVKKERFFEKAKEMAKNVD